jgi:two-component system sensor histidine kinase BaeS
MKAGLRARLSLAFFSVTALFCAIVLVLANFFVEKQFREYVVTKQAQKNSAIVALLAERYRDWGGTWSRTGLESIGMNTLGDGLILRVRDKNGAAVWDARVHNNGMCMAMLEHMAANMRASNPDFEGGYVEEAYPIVAGGQTAGSVDIGYYGPYFYTDIDMQYLRTINGLLAWGAVVSAAVSAVLGALLARQIARPVARAVAATQRIARGDYKSRIAEKPNTREIVELTDSVNSLAETLGKQETLRKRLTADVAHELRTPITMLQSHLEAMIDGTWEADTARLESCHEEVVRLSKLVGNLETLTRYENENVRLDVRRFDISALLKRIADKFLIEFQNKNIELILDAPEQMLEADEEKLSQVFTNLLTDALKYTPEGGRVEIRAEGSAHFVQVRVRDSGTGIAEEDLPHIFERFYRTDKSRAQGTGGTGIGLAIVRAIVEAHHGNVQVQSALNQGSVFTVTLPRQAGGNL